MSMSKSSFAPAVVATLLIATLAAAQDDRYGEHLEPEESVFEGHGVTSEGYYSILDEYDRLLVSALVDAYGENVVARVIVVPSFKAETAVGLREKDGTYKVFYLQPDAHLWAVHHLAAGKKALEHPGDADEEQIAWVEENVRALEKAVPADYREVKISKCERDVDAELGKRIHRLWVGMLRGTRYPDVPSSGMDGWTYHFSVRSNDRFGTHTMAGQSRNPPSNSNAGRLVAVAGAMRDFCDNSGRKWLDRLEKRVEELSEHLETE
ncbi:MAG: hypothetical protein ACLFWF_08105 [Alphaproteobacteria bacterium]